tara:strand:+ start:404 stop:586 length:183 start_codon:yes stop_codon:yes gene_type:complete
MKAGDLVQMKYEMWWILRDRRDYRKDVALVLEAEYNAVKLLHSDGIVKTGLAEHYEVVKT